MSDLMIPAERSEAVAKSISYSVGGKIGSKDGVILPTRAEQETTSAADRLKTQIDRAVAAVGSRSDLDLNELESCAAGLERSARDLAVALRELARERKTNAAMATS